MTFRSPIIPYLIRATYDWIVDARLIPYVEVDTSYPGVVIPSQFSNEKTIVLNIASQAVNRLKIDNQVIEFDARFSSQISHLYLPMPAVIAIYARENGFGMQFIPTIEYLGENIAFTDLDDVQKITTVEKTPKFPKKSDASHSHSKPKLILITKEKASENSNPDKKD